MKTRTEPIAAVDLRQGDAIRRASGEIMLVLTATQYGPMVMTQLRSARGTIMTQMYPASVPVWVVTR